MCSVKKVSLEISENSPEARNFIKNETLAQVFSCEFCEISKNTFFYRTPLMAAYVFLKNKCDAAGEGNVSSDKEIIRLCLIMSFWVPRKLTEVFVISNQKLWPNKSISTS